MATCGSPPAPRRPGARLRVGVPGGGEREVGRGRWGAQRRGGKNKREPRPLPGPARGCQSSRPLLTALSDWLNGDQSGARAASPCGPTWGGARGARGPRGVGGACGSGPRLRDQTATATKPALRPWGPRPKAPRASPAFAEAPERLVHAKRRTIFWLLCCAGPGWWLPSLHTRG